MITVEALNQLGADTKEGLARCMNNEAFYIRMVTMGLQDPGFEKLKEAIAVNDLKAAFEAAHALKGVMGNLSLTPIAVPVSEITEYLRAGTQMDYGPLLGQIDETYGKFRALLD